MSIQARNLIEAALKADLPKNSSKVFLAVFSKTVGYGKRRDYMTKNQLAGLTGIRKDRLDAALQTLIDLGLFEAKHYEHSYRFVIPDCFLVAGEDRFFSPSFPVNGEAPQKVGNLPENRVHTDTINTEIDLTQTNKAPAPVCAVTPSAFEEKAILVRPAEISEDDFRALKPALLTLPATTAQQVLDLTQLKIQRGIVRETVQKCAGYLITQARIGKLNTSELQPKIPEAVTPAPTDNRHKQDLLSKIRGLESLKQLAGSLDGRSEAQLATWKSELTQLQTSKQELHHVN